MNGRRGFREALKRVFDEPMNRCIVRRFVLQAGIDRLTLERQDSEYTFMNAT
jgi:hypothetical protein